MGIDDGGFAAAAVFRTTAKCVSMVDKGPLAGSSTRFPLFQRRMDEWRGPNRGVRFVPPYPP